MTTFGGIIEPDGVSIATKKTIEYRKQFSKMYQQGYVSCRRCALAIKWEGRMCPFCNTPLRLKPRGSSHGRMSDRYPDEMRY